VKNSYRRKNQKPEKKGKKDTGEVRRGSRTACCNKDEQNNRALGDDILLTVSTRQASEQKGSYNEKRGAGQPKHKGRTRMRENSERPKRGLENKSYHAKVRE